MRMDIQSINTLFDYNYGVHDRIWQGVMELTTEQFIAQSDYLWLSVRNHMVHLMSTDNRWLTRIQNHIDLLDRLEPTDYPDQDAVREKWNDIGEWLIAKFC